MYRAVSHITITQQPSQAWPSRNTKLYFDFCSEFECESTWAELTNKGTVKLPKNIYVKDEHGKPIALGAYYSKSVSNVNIGGFSSAAPLFLRGDAITISFGYRYFDNKGVEILDESQVFQGWISEVGSKIPIELKVEDNMWKLKQIQAPIHTFKPTDSLETILKFLLQGTGFTVNALTNTTFGAFTCGNETVAECLGRLRRLYHFESYFRGNELRSGSIVYLPGEAKTQNFSFQGNIISDELHYRRKDDLQLSATARNTYQEETGKICKDGSPKTKKVRLEILVTLLPGGRHTTFVKQKGQPYPPNTGGERRDLFFPGAHTVAELESLAIAELQKYYYTGLRGKFTTFAIPFVQQGDNAQITDPIYPERNGTYRIKSVQYSLSTSEGLRQEIELDYKLPTTGQSGT